MDKKVEFYIKPEYLSRVRMKRHFSYQQRLSTFTCKVVVAERATRRHM